MATPQSTAKKAVKMKNLDTRKNPVGGAPVFKAGKALKDAVGKK